MNLAGCRQSGKKGVHILSDQYGGGGGGGGGSKGGGGGGCDGTRWGCPLDVGVLLNTNPWSAHPGFQRDLAGSILPISWVLILSW